MTLTDEQIKSISQKEAPKGAEYLGYSKKIMRIIGESGSPNNVKVYEVRLRKVKTIYLVRIDESGNVIEKDYIFRV